MVRIRSWEGALCQPALCLAVVFAGILLSIALQAALRDRPTLAGEAVVAIGLTASPREHPTRRRILEYLRAIPGDHFRSIARNLGLSVGETRHHLDKLIRDGLLFERKEHARSRYYIRKPHADAERNELFSRQWAYRDLRMRILTRVRAEGSSSGGGVAHALGISRQLAAYHLARLTEMGFVQREGRRYRATPVQDRQIADGQARDG